MKLGEIAKLTKDNNNTKQGKCQQVRKTPPFYLHNLDNYQKFMQDKGDSEETIKHIGENQWKNAIYMWVVNYRITYNEPCPYKFPYDPWTVEQPEPVKANKKTKQEKREPVKQVKPEIRIPVDIFRLIAKKRLPQIEAEVFTNILIEILQWKHYRDNDYTAPLSQSKIAKLTDNVLRTDQISKALIKLQEKGLIKIIKKPGCKTNRGQRIQLLIF